MKYMNGKLIVFEGIDGSGKTTQCALLRDYLKEQHYQVLATREPGGTPVGEEVRRILLNPANVDLDHRTEAFLYAAARAQLVHGKIKPVLAAGELVLCDRFIDSTLAYQGYGRGLPVEFLQQINTLATQGLQPDLVLIFDLPVAASLTRIHKRSTGDRLEQETESFHNRVQQGYLAIARSQPHTHVILEATLPVQQLHQKVKLVVEEMLGAANYRS